MSLSCLLPSHIIDAVRDFDSWTSNIHMVELGWENKYKNGCRTHISLYCHNHTLSEQSDFCKKKKYPVYSLYHSDQIRFPFWVEIILAYHKILFASTQQMLVSIWVRFQTDQLTIFNWSLSHSPFHWPFQMGIFRKNAKNGRKIDFCEKGRV